MAFEIVDGMTGTKHISSDDMSALNTALVGKTSCVMEYGDDFKLTMASANSATLGTGVGMVGGKRFWNQAAVSLTVQSGTQGQNRHDLVVARYAKTSAGIESITPVVVKGTPTTGSASDPSVTSNDLVLWRIPLTGVSVGTPVKMFTVTAPICKRTVNTSPSEVAVTATDSCSVKAKSSGIILVIATISGTWGYNGQDLNWSIVANNSNLTALGNVNGRVISGNTVGRTAVCYALFSNANEGNTYTFKLDVTGTVGTSATRYGMMAIAL